MVDEDGAFFHAGQCTVGTEHHRAQVVVVAHANKHDVGTLSGFAGGGGGFGFERGELLGKRLSLGGRAVVNRDVVPGAGQVACHGVAHDAHAQKGDLGGGGGFVSFGVNAAHGKGLRPV